LFVRFGAHGLYRLCNICCQFFFVDLLRFSPKALDIGVYRIIIIKSFSMVVIASPPLRADYNTTH
jgi:hypothetical protein